MGFNFKAEQKKTPKKNQPKQLSWGERIDQAKQQMVEEKKPKPVKPATQGMGDFRQAESKMKPYKAPETSTNTAKEDRERFTKTLPTWLQGPVSKVNNLLTSAEESKGGKFYLRSGEKAANTAFLNNDEVKETTGNKKLDFAADIVGGIGGFINPQAPANAVFQGGTKLAEKGLGKIAPKLAQSKLATNVLGGAGAGAATGTAEGIIEGKNAKETAKIALQRGAEFGAVGAVGHAVGKGIGALARKYLSEGTLRKIELPKIEEEAPIIDKKGINIKSTQGKYKVKNTALEKAHNEYNEAIEIIQNRFGTNQLRKDEEALIKSELGIDLEKLVSNIEKAENFNPVSQLSKVAERNRFAQIAGLQDKPLLRFEPTKSPINAPKELPNINTLIPSKRANVRPIGINKLNPLVNEASPPLTLKENPIPLKPNVAGKNERQFGQSVINSQVATNDIKQGLKENPLTYEPITNKETFEKATHEVKKDPVKALEYFNSPSKGVNADDVAVGEALITKAIKEGNNNEANRLIADLAEKLTTAGQAVQAASIFKRLTPEGMLLYAQRMVNSINKEQLSKFGKQAKKVELTPEDTTFILDTMKKVQKLPEGREKDIGLAQINQLLANKSPATRSEKVKALQRISLLLNPRTMGRNIIGNAIFGGLDNVSNVIATPIDYLAGKLTGKRTATLPNVLGQLKSWGQGARETMQDAKLGINTHNAGTQYELPNKQIFKGDDVTNKVLNKLDQATRVGLEFGDRPFFKAAYDDVLRQQMKLANVTEPTQEMINLAHKIAEQRTYQDINGLTKAFKFAQQGLNMASEHLGIGTKEFGLGNLVLPFVKTPANILTRALEYSPLGVTKAFKEALKRNSTFDQRAFVDSIGRSVTGTAIIMLGYDLAQKGLITGSFSKDKDKAAFERSLGKNDFAFKIGDKYYTYDWAQPASMGLAIGADVFLRGKERKDAENIVADAIESGGETLFKQSLLQGLQRFIGGMNPIDSIESTAVNAPSQFIPTLSGQINQLTDPIQRNTYSDNMLGTGYNLIKGKIPGASQTLEPKVDTFGNIVKRNQGNNNLFNVFLNPGETTEYKPNKLQKEILRLYDVTGNKDVFPKVAPKYFKAGGERYDLTPKEQTKFQQAMGKRTEQLMNETKFEPFMTDDLRAKIFAKAIEKAYEEAKAELIKNRQK